MTTQAPVPVDDSIDAEVQQLLRIPKSERETEEHLAIARSLSARIASRADALIEREQVLAVIEEACSDCEGMGDFETGKATDRIMALLPRAPMPDDTEQIDNVLDVIETAVINKHQEWHGVPPSGEMVAEISKAVRHDLASAGIRLTYDTREDVRKAVRSAMYLSSDPDEVTDAVMHVIAPVAAERE